jgi:ATP phosphoribosyltransferase
VRLGIAVGPPRRTAAAVELAVCAGAPAEPLRGLAHPELVVRGGDTVALARPGDLLTLCRRDALDAAILGAEVLLERGPEVVELLDLNVGRARLVAAASPAGAGAAPGEGGGGDLPRRPLVATAHPRLTRRYLEARGYQPRLVELVDEPWLAGRLLRLDLVVGLVDEGEEPEPPFVARGEVAAGGLRLVAGLTAHALRGAELAAFAHRTRGAAAS